MTKAVAACLLFFGALHLVAQEPGPQPSTLTVTTRELVLDVIAEDKSGHSVHDLQMSDFLVMEDGVPQRIKSLTEHRAMSEDEVAALLPANALPPNTFSSFRPNGNRNAVNVILIDALDSPTRAQMYLREQVIAFLKSAPQGNQFAIFELDTQMHLVQGLTSDPAVLLRAVQSKRDMTQLSRAFHGLDSKVRDELVNAGLESVGRYLAAFSGRKNLIWFTSYIPKNVYGLKRNPFPDAIDFDKQSSRSANAQSLSDVAIYPIDGRGLELGSAHVDTHEKMDVVAERTGGKAYVGTNGLKQALREIAETGSNYYTLSYTPTNPEWAAHHREIDLQVKRNGVELLYRHQYFARGERKAQKVADARLQTAAYTPQATPADTGGTAPVTAALLSREAARPQFLAAMDFGSVPAGELLFSVAVERDSKSIRLARQDPLPKDFYLADAFLEKPFRNYHLTFQIDPSRVRFYRASDGQWHASLECVTVVYTDLGEQVNALSSTLTVALSDVRYEAVMSTSEPLTVEEDLAVPEKGNYFFHSGVHDLTADTVGTVELPVDTILKN